MLNEKLAQIVLKFLARVRNQSGVTVMKRTEHVARTGFIAWLLLISLFVGQSPAAGKNKANAGPDRNSARPITVHVAPLFALEGSPVHAMVRVAPNSENRMLRMTVDSQNYYRSSEVQLDGDNAAITHYLPMNSLPAGDYAFLAVVYGPHGERARSYGEFRLLPFSQ